MIEEMESNSALNSKIKSKELGVIELFISGAQVYKNNFIPILIVSLIIYLPILLVQETISPIYNQTSEGNSLAIWISWLTIFLQVLAGATIITIVEQYVLQNTSRIIQAFRRSFSKWAKLMQRTSLIWAYEWEVLVALLLFFIADISTQFSPFIYPLPTLLGIAFLTKQFFFIHAAYLRDLDVKSACTYSRSLVQGRWKKVFLTLVALLINIYFLLYITAIISGSIVTVFPNIVFIAGITLRFIFQIIWNFWFIVGAIFFLNLEYRKS